VSERHDRPPFVHETAIVEPDVFIGSETNILHHCRVRRGASIGDGCTLGKNVYIDAGVHIGNRVKIQNNVSVYAGVRLEDEVFVGPSAVFTNDPWPRATNEDWKLRDTLVMHGASIGANSTIVCGIEIGSWASVAAGSVVTKDVLSYELVGGTPAKRMGWMCECGSPLVIGQGDFPHGAVCPNRETVAEGGDFR
jgi:UDP-2-acetamido-3-amino-2,3-dideoxy-glucuronate N-acetyltransferase